MPEQIGMTQDEKREKLAFARELLITAQQFRQLSVPREDLGEMVNEYCDALIEMAIFELGYVVEVADAEIQTAWRKDPRNPLGDSSKPTGFMPSADSE